jgi:tRNA pseudouridine38-40 synthase
VNAGADSVGVTALTVAYDGAPYSGFALQPDVATVQGTLEEALRTVLRREVETTGAGRTDAGVHARGQVVSFEAPPDEADDSSLRRSLNALAAPHISIRDVRSARPGFSARFDAVSREYRYRIAMGDSPPVFTAPFAWWVKSDLDAEAMHAAASRLVGEHDFRSFCVAESAEGKRTVREVLSLDVHTEDVLGEEALVVGVVGNAFLHSMVRVIVGSLVEVGMGRRSPEWIGEALEACDRASAGATAPAHGLTLWEVEYPESCWSER